MSDEEEIATIYRLIEKHFGGAMLMQFQDLISENNGE